MTWSRGFFRIWIVLTITWVIGAGVMLWRPMFGGGAPVFERWYTFSWYEDAVQLGPLDEDFQNYVSLGQPLPPGIKWTTLRSTDFAYHLKHAEKIDPSDLAKSLAVVQADLDELQRSQDAARRESMPFFIGIFVVPPLLVLGIGALIGWIARGFRSPA